MSESRLHQLSALGQSVWIDYLSRDLLRTGELERMMREDAVVGVTSNPTIFQKAIAAGGAYDEQLMELGRETNDRDRETYQTVYANQRGAIAAPTAGLHFTQEILDRIPNVVRITLHVGIGTFEPVKVDDVSKHVMHSERYEISEEAAAKLRAAKSIVAVGTTTVRALESSAPDFKPGSRETNIFITPGYEFKAVDKLLTNFHLPESTLLMLVSAFAGVDTIRRAYAEAIRERYAFYSYGDCMFIR